MSPSKGPTSGELGDSPNFLEELYQVLTDYPLPRNRIMADFDDTPQANPPEVQSGMVVEDVTLNESGPKKVDPPENAYEDSPNPQGITIQTHDRDSVQPPTDTASQYAPEAKLKDEQ
mgnify:FL=1